MVFVYRYWDQFCRELQHRGLTSIPAAEVSGETDAFLVLKHDIESQVSKALHLAEIEHQYGHRGSFYAHACLLDRPENVRLLKSIREMGHEVSYHHDVMDSNRGDLTKAVAEFEANVERFETLGFPVKTVCQHGNPVVERIGYTSNRDFFRSAQVQWRFPQIADIMVDFKEKHHTEYSYYSDVGRCFQKIFDPINNDVVNSDDKNIPFEDLDALLSSLDRRAIVSTHPHRWTASAGAYLFMEKAFKLIKKTAKALMRIPFMKKIMSRYYYLARKI